MSNKWSIPAIYFTKIENRKKMLNRKLSSHIVTAGPRGNGGINSVIEAYARFFHPFHSITTVRGGNILCKAAQILSALFFVLWYRTVKHCSVFHVHSACYRSFYRKKLLATFAKTLGYKVIFHIHGAEFKVFTEQAGKTMIASFLAKCDKVIALSEEWKEYFEHELQLVNVECIPNIIPNPVLNITPHETDKIRLLFLGAIGKRKGIFDLMELLAEHKEWADDVELHIGGDGETGKLLDFIHRNNMEKNVFFYGWVKGEEKVKLFKQCNVYILPSYFEGVPISILEAMNYSLPIISTDVGGIPSIVQHGKNGFLFTPGDKEVMRQAISHFLQDRSLITALGQESFEQTRPHLPESVEKKLTSIYAIMQKAEG